MKSLRDRDERPEGTRRINAARSGRNVGGLAREQAFRLPLGIVPERNAGAGRMIQVSFKGGGDRKIVEWRTDDINVGFLMREGIRREDPE